MHYHALPKEDGDDGPVVRDHFLLSPLRLYKVCMTYWWWLEQRHRFGCTVGSFASHCFYYRREYARYRLGGGYHDSWRTTWRAYVRSFL